MLNNQKKKWRRGRQEMTSIKKKENIKEGWNIAGKKKIKERDNIKVEGIEVIEQV